MNCLEPNDCGRKGLAALGFRAPPFLAMVAMNSPRAGRARLLQGENYV